ncbi:jg3259 [Pararge aegeria aegeria]|uniref:Jg3259 protein n=1 Tax=Pararge aegeria aegeria TaxID=348720 RepID=A0A8S4RZZ2_9NEOP|nr:jg3259 [Pararge aegeria aegeria]
MHVGKVPSFAEACQNNRTSANSRAAPWVMDHFSMNHKSSEGTRSKRGGGQTPFRPRAIKTNNEEKNEMKSSIHLRKHMVYPDKAKQPKGNKELLHLAASILVLS